MSIKDLIVRTPVLGRCILLWHRYRVARSYLMPPWRRLRPWLFSSRETTNFTYDLQPTGKVLIGDSIESLTHLGVEIDLFINDSDHSAEYEGREYRTVERALGPHAMVVGDNAHVTDELPRFARRTGRAYLYFQERPKDHWYPGGGIGVAFRRRPRAAP